MTLQATPSPQRWRLFIALFPPETWQAPLVALQRSLACQLHKAPIRWVRPDQIHVTLRFIGGVDPSALPNLIHSLQNAAATISPFTLEMADLGTFPAGRSPRVLWIGLAGNLERIIQLHRSIERETDTRGISEASPTTTFQPHLTLARLKAAVPRLRTVLAAQTENGSLSRPPRSTPSAAASGSGDGIGSERTPPSSEDASWKVDQFDLVRSELHASGPAYTILKRFPLLAGPS